MNSEYFPVAFISLLGSLLSLQGSWKHLEGRAGSYFFSEQYIYRKIGAGRFVHEIISCIRPSVRETLCKCLLVDRYKV